ncbi:MAG TPA: 3' terminal RNA ribose 2'-O-methyltransferase Hen1 [Pyrinomonadaceae bacterium]|nr:3' terminal RNA ribose 2'-O-methyltransferase Hen1 [Pyrinomonadaceae bacterium]
MLLTISTTHNPATDLGFLLHKNPSRIQSFPLSFGTAHVFYPEVSAAKCTVALLLDIDPVGLVRGKGRDNRTLEQYVNDRPYVASSFFSVALGRVFSSALAGKSESHRELADTEIPLEAVISVLPSRGGEDLLRKLFEPLGYEIETTQLALDESFPEWGESPYFKVVLRATKRLQDLLTHLYVLIPVLDNEKHYWVGDEEVEKLLRRGNPWLATHPERETIARRYLKFRSSLAREVLARLLPEEAVTSEIEFDKKTKAETAEEVLEKPLSLNEQRYREVISVLQDSGAKRVVDVGCGEGKLLRYLLEAHSFEEIVGLDVSHRVLEIASERLKMERLPDKMREKIKLLHGSLTYRDKRLEGFDAAIVVEVIEHLDTARLSAFERVLFEFARPVMVVLTTPNSEYNVKFETLPAGKFRHADHRFEWTRAEFRTWADNIATRFDYKVIFKSVGEEDAELGAPTQMAVFSK